MSWAAIVPWNFPCDGLLEAGPGARHRQLGDPETLREIPSPPCASRHWRRKRASPTGVQRCRALAIQWVRRWPCTWTSTASPSPAPTKIGKHLVQCPASPTSSAPLWSAAARVPTSCWRDALDLDAAARSARRRHLLQPGEVCTAASRLLVQNSIKPPVHGAAAGPRREMDLGQPTRPTTRIGAAGGPHPDGAGAQLHRHRPAGRAPSCWASVPSRRARLHRTRHLRRRDPDVRIFARRSSAPCFAADRLRHLEEAIALATTPTTARRAAIWTADLNQAVKGRALRRQIASSTTDRGGDDHAVWRLQAVRQRARQSPCTPGSTPS